MSPSLASAESQWLSQLATMRAAIAEMNLAKPDPDVPEYGHDLQFEDEDVLPIKDTDEFWDLISDISEEDCTSEAPTLTPPESTQHDAAPTGYNRDWLNRQCASVASRNSGLDANSLQEQVQAVLASDSNGNRISFPVPTKKTKCPR